MCDFVLCHIHSYTWLYIGHVYHDFIINKWPLCPPGHHTFLFQFLQEQTKLVKKNSLLSLSLHHRGGKDKVTEETRWCYGEIGKNKEAGVVLKIGREGNI